MCSKRVKNGVTVIGNLCPWGDSTGGDTRWERGCRQREPEWARRKVHSEEKPGSPKEVLQHCPLEAERKSAP